MEKLLHTLFGKFVLVAILCGLVYASPTQVLAADSPAVSSFTFILDDGVSGDTGFGIHTSGDVQTVNFYQTCSIYFRTDSRLNNSDAAFSEWATGPPTH